MTILTPPNQNKMTPFIPKMQWRLLCAVLIVSKNLVNSLYYRVRMNEKKITETRTMISLSLFLILFFRNYVFRMKGVTFEIASQWILIWCLIENVIFQSFIVSLQAITITLELLRKGCLNSQRSVFAQAPKRSASDLLWALNCMNLFIDSYKAFHLWLWIDADMGQVPC